jgi:hypothetical protein
VKSWLESEGWDQLSTEKIFNENEGFLNKWPEGLSFEKIIDDFKKAHPKLELDEDDLILMVLWISGRLPQEDSGL